MDKSNCLNELTDKSIHKSQKLKKNSLETTDNYLRAKIFNNGSHTRFKTAKTPDIRKIMSKDRYMKQKEKEKSVLQRENIKLSQKIRRAKGSFSVKKWNVDFQKSREYIKMHSKHQRSKTPKDSSQRKSHRVLIDTLNTYFIGKTAIRNPSDYPTNCTVNNTKNLLLY
ncbi:hypothetical protein SteCoe_13952 [Stentor coeruleus]|uniref:Uncharacterized protein n=1 Tax=Stentor coeruleus TaxID=5963 RepID=A0A1R2C734_9CILI|nr:hypothetical protein SteCoe_13952 [Stentor coeruleus]